MLVSFIEAVHPFFGFAFSTALTTCALWAYV